MTMLNDPIGDLLTRMRNAQAARRGACSAPWSRIKTELCEVLKREGWIRDVSVSGEGIERAIDVTFIPGKRLTIKRISTPGRRVYASSKELKPVLRGFGMAVLTTSQGLLTDAEARAKKVGGEVLCTIS
ncbi:MAG: small subunit ribosomal protein S8 [Candidatus Peregrinibacteria bacterium Gr01-1014_25]|nr:MAG: small subunit ribosomal protein S8 [Candidatus Peregrinibacteria bacterium Gr01-1014_25]